MDVFQVQHSWGDIATRLFGRGQAAYRLNAMYLEFANVASPGDTVAVPSFSKFDGRGYYDALAGADYLRVPISGEPAIEVADGFAAAFPDPLTGNTLVAVGLSAGTVGVNGLPFSDTVNSVVYGVALVAAPVWADKSQDVIFLRGYYDPANQIPKRAGRQLAVTVTHTFGEL